MIAEINSLSFRDQAFMVALATIGERFREIAREDRDDLRELLKEYFSTEDDESRESAARGILEICAQASGEVIALNLPPNNAAHARWSAMIGQRIRDLRLNAGLTQDQLAEKSGLTQSHICRLETGQHSPNGLTIEKIAAALNVSTAEIDHD
jgi:DNA-binding XRE family transcriptional regulator